MNGTRSAVALGLCLALLGAAVPAGAQETRPGAKYESDAGWGIQSGIVPGFGIPLDVTFKPASQPFLVTAGMVAGYHSFGMGGALDWRLTNPEIRWKFKAYYGPGVGIGFKVREYTFQHVYVAARFVAGLEWVVQPGVELYVQVSGMMGISAISRSSVEFPYLSLPFLTGFRYWL